MRWSTPLPLPSVLAAIWLALAAGWFAPLSASRAEPPLAPAPPPVSTPSPATTLPAARAPSPSSDYQQLVKAAVERHWREVLVARGAGQEPPEGTVRLAFRVNPDGGVFEVVMRSGQEHGALIRQAVEQARIPAMPAAGLLRGSPSGRRPAPLLVEFTFRGVGGLTPADLPAPTPAPGLTPPPLLASPLVRGEELPAEEAQALRAEAVAWQRAVTAGDWEAAVAKAPAVVVSHAGGPAPLVELVRRMATGIEAKGVHILEVVLGPPSPLYSAGSARLCFLPRAALAEAAGRQVRLNSYVVAVRSPDEPGWRFLDGAGSARDPQMIWRFYPELPRELNPPLNGVAPAPPATGR